MNWSSFLLLSLLALVFPALSLLRRRTAGVCEANNEANIALYRERLAEINELLGEGSITRNQAEQLIAEQQQVLLQDTSDSEAGPSSAGTSSRNSALLVILLGLLAPLLAFVLYQQLGASDDLEILALIEQRSEQVLSEQQDQLLREQLVAKVTKQLAAEPEQAAYLVMLARLHLQDGDIAKAVDRYEQAAALLSNNAQVQAEYAQAVYFSEQGRFTNKVILAVDRALQLDPGNVTALGLRGVKAFERQDYHAAITDWQTALRWLPAQSSQADVLKAGIQRARAALGQALPGLTVELALAEGLQAKPDQVIYVFARQPKGPPMPLAVSRINVSDLPASVTLDDSMAMPGGKVLSSASRIEVVARISSSGSVSPQTGDLQGVSEVIALSGGIPQQPIALEIDTRLP